MPSTIRRLIQITDPHIGPARDYRLAGVETLETLREVLAEIGSSAQPPELICATGDIAADGSAEAYRLFTQQLQFLELPYQWLPGNHDDPQLIREGLTATPYWPLLELGSWRILSLDTSVPGEVGGYLAAEELGFLTAQLEREPTAPTLVFMHHPPVPVGCAWLDAQRIANAVELEVILKRHHNVRALFSGHVHQQFHTIWAGTQVHTTPATCFQFRANSPEFGLSDQPPGYRWIDLYPDGRLVTDCSYLELPALHLDRRMVSY